MSPDPKSKKIWQQRYFVFLVFGVLLSVYLVMFGDSVLEVLDYPQWLIAPIMSLGSFVAGATFLGGGAVAFPALTKILGADPITAKTFSLAIQSVGMTAASIYILSRVRCLPFTFILFYTSAACAGLTVSLTFFQTLFTSSDIRIGFTLFVVCFLLVYLNTHKNVSGHPERSKTIEPFDHEKIYLDTRTIPVVALCGFIGGVVSGLIGSGADLLAFSMLALYFRMEIKLATQISIIAMAATSIFGILMQFWIFQNVPEQVVDLWLIAAPVVLLGAPLGAIFCRRTTSRSLLAFICAIVVVEVISTFLLVSLEREKFLFYFLSFLTAIVFLVLLFWHSPYHSRRHISEETSQNNHN